MSERRAIRRQERKARQKLGHGHIINPDAPNGSETNLKGAPSAVKAKRDPLDIQAPGQLYAVISWVAPNGRQKAKHIAIKLRGVFGTVEAAKTHAAKIYAVDPDFDIHVVDMYEWLVIPPPPEHQMQIQMEYNQAKLDRIMQGYYGQIRRQKQKHDARVANALAEGKRKATEWRREHGFTASESLTKELDPENPERVPVLPQRPLTEGGFVTDAIKESREARAIMEAEMEAKGATTVQEAEFLRKEQEEFVKSAPPADLMRAAIAEELGRLAGSEQ